MAAKNRKRKLATLHSSDDPMQQPVCTSTRTQVGRRVSNEAVQERQNRDRILPNSHRHGSTNLVLNDGFEDNHLVEGQSQSAQLQESIQQNMSNTISMTDEVQTGHEKKHRGPTHMKEIWGRPSTLSRIQLDFDRYGRPIGPNQSKFCEFLGTVARNGMYCPLDVEDWHKMPSEYQKRMLHIVKSRYDITLGNEGWILSSINRKWRNWKSNLKTKYFVEDKHVEDLLSERDERVLEDQWANMLAYWNKEEARSEKNIIARSKRSMNHLTGKRSFAQIYDKLAKEKGRPPSRAELLDACYTSNGNAPPIVSKYLEQIEELRNELPEGSEDPVGPNDLFAQVSGQDKPGCVRMFGEGVSPSDVWGEVPNRNMCKRVMLEQRSEMQKMKCEIAELQSQLLAREGSTSHNSLTPSNFHNSTSTKQPLQVGDHVALKSIVDQSKIVAKGCLHSVDPNVEVGRQVLGENWCQVHIKVVVQSEERLIRPYGYCQVLGDALGEMVAWPCNLVTLIG